MTTLEKLKPFNLYIIAQRFCDLCYARIKHHGDPDELIVLQLGILHIVLFTSFKARDDYHIKKFGTKTDHNTLSFVGAPEDLSYYYFWLPFKRLKNGLIVFNIWVLAHEFKHLIDRLLARIGMEDDMINPDLDVYEENWL